MVPRDLPQKMFNCMLFVLVQFIYTWAQRCERCWWIERCGGLLNKSRERVKEKGEMECVAVGLMLFHACQTEVRGKRGEDRWGWWEFFSKRCVLGLTCVEVVLLSGAAAVNGEGGAREGVVCCCCDNSALAPPMATAAVPDDDPSAAEKTPVER